MGRKQILYSIGTVQYTFKIHILIIYWLYLYSQNIRSFDYCLPFHLTYLHHVMKKKKGEKGVLTNKIVKKKY